MSSTSILERPDILQQVRENAELGLHNNDIAHLVGCHPITLNNWYERGLTDVTNGKRNTKYARLYFVIAHARSSHYKETLTDIKNQSRSGNDRASKLLLEQSKDYRHETQIDIRITQETVSKLTTEQLLALRAGDKSVLANVIDSTAKRLPMPEDEE